MDTLTPSNTSVAITGIGMICPLGLSAKESWEKLVSGKSGIRRITRFDASGCATQIAGEIPDDYFELEREILPKRVRETHVLPSRLALMVAREAVEDAGFMPDPEEKRQVAVISGCGGSALGDELAFKHPRRAQTPLLYDMLHEPAAAVSRDMDLGGPSFNVATACASGAFAVGLGFDHVRASGHACIALGVETMVLKEVIDGFNNLLALSERNEDPTKASRPFDKKRDGFVISEGACALVLEPKHAAIRRGARIYAYISGYAFCSEAFNIIAPEPTGEGMARSMEEALRLAGISKGQVGYISAHGTSTPHNDVAETKAIKRVFGERAYKIPVSSQKSMVGHSIGAAGAMECAVTALSLYHQVITPTINYEEPDPQCDLDYVPNLARKVAELEVAISNSFGFGGHNSTIVLHRAQPVGLR